MVGELRIALAAAADVAGIDAVLRRAPAAQAGCAGEELVAVEVEVADRAARHSPRSEPVADVRDRGGRLVGVDRHAHQLGSGRARARAPARAVAATSAVSVLVIDCTTTGAPPPTLTAPMRTRDRGSARLRSLRFLCGDPGRPRSVRRCPSGTAPVESTVSVEGPDVELVAERRLRALAQFQELQLADPCRRAPAPDRRCSGRSR